MELDFYLVDLFLAITPGVTGSVIWDSVVILGKFLEHVVDSGHLFLQGKKVVDLGSGCGVVGCIAALLGAQATLTGLLDRLRLLNKNVDTNRSANNIPGSAAVAELTWGDDSDSDILDPLILGSDVIYSEGAVGELLFTLQQLCGSHTTVVFSGELGYDAVLEYFLEAAMEDFLIGRVDQTELHREYSSHRIVVYILVKKNSQEGTC